MKYILASLLFFFSIANSIAQIPRTISYQGVLADANGTFIKDGNHSLVLNLYLTATGGAAIYSETQSIPVVRGIFNVIIGSQTAIPLSLNFDRAYFLGVSVDGGAELSPRTALSAVPYALYAARAAVADGLSPNATGVVTSINEQAGALRIVGAGGTTVTNAANVFTISSVTGGGSAFNLPYSDSAANGAKSIFNIVNTSTNGNTISGIGSGGSGIGGMTTSAIFGDGGEGYNGVTGFSNGGANTLAGVVGHAIGSANGVMAISAAGDAVNARSSLSRAGFFQTPSNSNTIEAINTGNGEAFRGTAANIGIHGISSASTGVLGETQSPTGIGVNAKYSGPGNGTALQLDNGAIKVSGLVRSAFVHVATAANIWGGYNNISCTELNNPLCNGDSTAIIFVMHISDPSSSLPTDLGWGGTVYYDTGRQKWQLFEAAYMGISVGEKFAILIIKR